jgi:hypothetical protein
MSMSARWELSTLQPLPHQPINIHLHLPNPAIKTPNPPNGLTTLIQVLMVFIQDGTELTGVGFYCLSRLGDVYCRKL